jgi:hypothetical protein
VVRTTGKNFFFVAKLEDVPPCTEILVASARTKSGTLPWSGVNLAMVNISNEGCRQYPSLAMSHQAELTFVPLVVLEQIRRTFATVP